MKFIARSLLILLALYGLVFVIGDLFLAHEHASVWWAIGFSIGLVGIQYLVGPWFIEWLMTIVWDDDASLLPEANREFVKKLCAERGIKVPRIGIIYSGTPNAFSFGHTPGNARVVITKGLLDILTPEEANAVLAHEIGHVEHWDFAVMAVAALAPLLLYQLYMFTRNQSGSARVIAWTAYLCYWVSQFIVLLLNRTREYMADHYSAQVTGQPNVLSSALVKIACGLVRADGEYAEKIKSGTRQEKKSLRREQRLGGALAVMGISNVQSGAALALGGANSSEASAVMRWDLVNPWARMYELNSTHPLTAFRVLALNRDSEAMHQGVQYPLSSDRRIEWGRFPFEVVLWAAPVLAAWALFIAATEEHWLRLGVNWTSEFQAKLLIITGAAWILRTWYRYHGEFEHSTIGSLIRDTQVSQMNARAVRLAGEIVGRGVPGAFWSPDLVLRDDTGMLFILYRQSIPFARFLFALNADEYIGQPVVIEGWFRRGLRPYVEMSTLTTNDGKTSRAWSRWVQYLLAVAAMVAGYFWLTAWL